MCLTLCSLMGDELNVRMKKDAYEMYVKMN